VEPLNLPVKSRNWIGELQTEACNDDFWACENLNFNPGHVMWHKMATAISGIMSFTDADLLKNPASIEQNRRFGLTTFAAGQKGGGGVIIGASESPTIPQSPALEFSILQLA
jgi:hypothetical protein